MVLATANAKVFERLQAFEAPNAKALGFRRERFDYWARRKQTPTSTAEVSYVLVRQLSLLFSIPEARSVAVVLSRHPEIVDVLYDASVRIRSVFGDTRSRIIRAADPEGYGEKLFISIPVFLSVRDARLLRKRLDEIWWREMSARVGHVLNIDIEYVG